MVDLASGIQAGSTEYGDRQALEAGLSQLPNAAPLGNTATPDGGEPLPAAGSPLEMLLSGELGEDADPVTAGLSVGSGPGPVAQSPFTDDAFERLRFVAENAKTPRLRAMARATLRRRVREAKL